jgi:hypothetical protein
VNGDTLIHVVKDATFKVYSPDEDTTRRPVDIVFLMDNSGSMQGEQAAVAANVEKFVNDLDTSGFDYRLALCRFGQSSGSGVPILYNNAAWYSDASDFLNVWDKNTVNGGREPSWDALIESAQGYDFADAAQKVFVLITDEAMTGNNINYSVCQDRQEVIDILQGAGVTLFTLVPSGATFKSDFGDVADSTGGMSFLITNPFNEILDSIGKKINSTYTVRYTPTWPFFDGFVREVDLMVCYNSDTLVLNGSYVPGSSPIIIRTDQTLALEKKNIYANDVVNIEAYVYDHYPPNTQSVTLFYRIVGNTGAYNPVSMSQIITSTGQTVWSGQILQTDVQNPGIEYYIKATDGQSTTTAPEFIDMEGYPWSFAVLPNVAPEIYDLTETDSLHVGDSVCFRANATDVTDSIGAVYLYIRAMNDISFSVYEMTKDTGDTYIYDEYILEEGITEYFFIAEDNHGVSTFCGDENSPMTIIPEETFEIKPTPYKHTINLAGIDLSSFPFSFWTADVIYDGNPLVYGDKIGVFYTDTICDSQGNCLYEHKCAGRYNYTGNLTIGSQILVYGDNPLTSVKEGFAEGEEFLFKVYKKADSSTHLAEFNFRLPLMDTTYKNGGSSNVDSIWAVIKQATVLEQGLNLWSTCLVPKESSFNSIFENQPFVNQVSDDQGNIWMPNQTNNTLTDYIPGYGYEVFMDSISILDVFGSRLDLSTLSVSLVGNQQSTLIGCPYSSPQNVEHVFSSYTGNIYAVDKYVNDGTGLISIETYSPMFSINNWTDKNMYAGEAYYVFAAYPENSFTYPAATGAYRSSKSAIDGALISQRVHSQKNYMHLFVPENAWVEKPDHGSELRVYNSNNELVGKNRISEQGTLVVLDGFSMIDGDVFNLYLWSPATGQENIVEVESWKTGSDKYNNLKSAVASELKINASNSITVFPNPTEGNISVSFSIEEENYVGISVMDMSGKTVLSFDERKYSAGNQSVSLDISSLSAGNYRLMFHFNDGVIVKQIIKK